MCDLQDSSMLLCVVVHICNPGPWEDETSGFHKVQGQSDLQSMPH